MSDRPFQAPAPGVGQQEYLAYLYARKKNVARLIDAVRLHLQDYRDKQPVRILEEADTALIVALGAYLYDNIDDAIARMEAPPPDYRPSYTIEDLMEAQKMVDMAQQGMDALDNMCRDLHEHGQESSADFMRNSQMMQLEIMLKSAKSRVAEIQQVLETPPPDPSNPWPGTHRISTICATCAKSFPEVATSVKKLHPLLEAAGWKRDADGDHICRVCAGKTAANTMRGEA